MSLVETNEQALPKIDFRGFWVNSQYKLLIPLVAAIVIATGSYKLTKTIIPNKWESSTFLIRHSKNMSSQTDIPYLYLKTDLSTLLETILLRDNLLIVIDKLNLNITPEALRNRIKIAKGGKSNVVEVKVTWNDPEMTTQIADLVSLTFLENYTQVQNSAARKIHQYYENKMSATEVSLYTARVNERSFLEQNNILDFEAQKENLYKSLSQIELRLVDERIRQNDLKAQLTNLSLQLRNIDGKVITSELLKVNEGNRTKALKNKLEVLKKRYTEDNPKVKHLLHKIAVLELEQDSSRTSSPKFDEVEYGPNPIFEELTLKKLDLESQLISTYGSIKSYKQRITFTTQEIESQAKVEQKHYRLKQNIESNETLLNTINNRLIETSLALESNISDFDILEPAQIPEHPKRSFRKIIAIGLATFSALIITGIILLREFINTSIKTSFDLKHITGAKFSAVLPNKDEVSESLFYSQYQLLFSETSVCLNTQKNKLLTISSMSEGEGKSFITNEIIDSYLRQGKKVLHIESEAYLNEIPNNSIINNALNQGMSLSEVRTTNISAQLDKCYFQIDKQIYIDIMREQDIEYFLSSCFKSYDIVIWETFSPNMHLQLFKTITKQAGFNLLLTQSRQTPKTVMNNTLKMLNNWGISEVGIVLNKLPKKYIKTLIT
jgi:capsular polysaccharide biosynthesis protein